MKKYIVVFWILVLVHGSVFAQQKDWGIGIRLGDPTGVSAKKYIGSHRALEINFGRTGWGHNYEKAFYRNTKFDRYYNYRWSRVESAVGLQLHYLIHRPFPEADLKGLDWYYGFGGQLRAFTVGYQYEYYYMPNQKNREIRYEQVRDIDVGVDGVIGLEYSWKAVPISVFGEMNLFMELADNPFIFYLQGGAGIRYYF